jgi:hypothetical protein
MMSPTTRVPFLELLPTKTNDQLPCSSDTAREKKTDLDRIIDNDRSRMTSTYVPRVRNKAGK